MYTQLRTSLQRSPAKDAQPAAARSRPRVSPNVIALGCTSLFTDISSEMVSSVLPLYFLVVLGFSALSFGVVDGLYQGASALISLFGGVIADRWRRRKLVAGGGYGLSALARFGLLAAGSSWGILTSVIVVDRIGKGIRTAPRDALIALSSSPDALGFAFGVHRALDTMGALLGPIIAYALLSNAPNAFDAVFVCSCCAALVGFAVLLLFVEERPHDAPAPAADSVAPHARSPLARADLAKLLTLARFGPLVVISTALALATISDSFLYLVLQRGFHLSLGLFPLLYVGTSLAYFLLAIPAGWLADSIGTGRVFLAGYVLLLLVSTALLRPSSHTAEVVIYLTLFGAYYAATDGVLMAHASAALPETLRSSGLALLTTATSIANLCGSVLFGALWTWRGQHTAVVCFVIALALSVLLAAVYFVRTGWTARPPDAAQTPATIA